MLPEKSITGLLGGLVAITAGASVLSLASAMLIGAAGGAIAVWGAGVLERRFRIDDAVGAIGIHGFAGVVGTIGLAILAPMSALPLDSRWDQIGVQVFGVALNFVWAFGLGILAFAAIAKLVRLRVSETGEELGLNETEHSTRIGIGHIEHAFDRLVEGNADLSLRLDVEEGDDAERLGRLFNALMDTIENEETAKGAVAEKHRAEEEAERLSALADATFEAIVICADGRIIDGNVALEQLTGLTLDAMREQSLKDLVFKDDVALFVEHFQTSGGEPYEVGLVHTDGTRIPVEVRSREIAYRGQATHVAAMVDLRERKIAEEKIRHLAQYDPLSELPNRALFSDRLEQLFSAGAPGHQALAVMLLDLDHFKDINDLHGHAAGDLVIQETGKRLKGLIGDGGIVARLGGDEFAVILSQAHFVNQATDFAHRVTVELGKPIVDTDGMVLQTAASIGLVCFPDFGQDTGQILSRADAALYRAKEMGRNTYCVYEPGMDEEDRRKRAVDAELGDALLNDQFVVYFQPRLTTATGKIDSYEALLRWNHPEKGIVSPGEFISVAERSGKIAPIGAWVMREACRLAKEQLGTARVSVNVSTLQFREKNFVQDIAKVLDDTGLPPEQLEIEVTESLLIDDDERALAALRAIKKIGCHIALDDFGTGYSSLGYLSRFPFDCIKIDQSFVRDMRASKNASAIIDTIIRLGRATDMRIVAEGVERVEELGDLAELGCDEMQGYLIGRPVPISELRRAAPADVLAALSSIDEISDANLAQLRSIGEASNTGSKPKAKQSAA